MPDGLPGILRHQLFQVGLGAFVLLVGRPGAAEGGRKLCPAVRSTHIDDTDRFQAGSGWFDPEQPGLLPAHHAAPELLLGGQQQVLVHRIGRHGELDPFAAPGDDGQDGGPCIGDPHVVLQLGHMLLDGPLLRERPGQHELGFEDGPAGIDHPVQGGRHPFDDGMLDPPLHVLDGMTGVALVPAPVEVLGDGAELDD